MYLFSFVNVIIICKPFCCLYETKSETEKKKSSGLCIQFTFIFGLYFKSRFHFVRLQNNFFGMAVIFNEYSLIVVIKILLLTAGKTK